MKNRETDRSQEKKTLCEGIADALRSAERASDAVLETWSGPAAQAARERFLAFYAVRAAELEKMAREMAKGGGRR